MKKIYIRINIGHGTSGYHATKAGVPQNCPLGHSPRRRNHASTIGSHMLQMQMTALKLKKTLGKIFAGGKIENCHQHVEKQNHFHMRQNT